MLRQCFAFLADEPPVLVDWLPWNHTFGGNHNVGIALYNGGTLYIDEGKPTPKGIEATLRNLREIAPTIYFNVPKGFEEIARAMDHDADLRASCTRASKPSCMPVRPEPGGVGPAWTAMRAKPPASASACSPAWV